MRGFATQPGAGMFDVSPVEGEKRMIAGVPCVYSVTKTGGAGYRGEGPSFAVFATPPEKGSEYWYVALSPLGGASDPTRALAVDLDDAALEAMRLLAVKLGLHLICRIGSSEAV